MRPNRDDRIERLSFNLKALSVHNASSDVSQACSAGRRRCEVHHARRNVSREHIFPLGRPGGPPSAPDRPLQRRCQAPDCHESRCRARASALSPPRKPAREPPRPDPTPRRHHAGPMSHLSRLRRQPSWDIAASSGPPQSVKAAALITITLVSHRRTNALRVVEHAYRMT
jgi:hypothetical protein